MKKVLAITLMLLLCATAAMASETSWRFLIKADNGAGDSPSMGAYVGVYGNSVDTLDTQDGSSYVGFGGDTPGTGMHVATTVVNQTDLWGKDIKSPTAPAPEKVWTLYVAAGPNSENSVIRLYAQTISGTTLAPTAVGGRPVSYFIRMVDNKGKVGAPAIGTKWAITPPAAHVTAAPSFWYAPINLPIIKLAVGSNDMLKTYGYKLELVQAVPEPSSLVALGAGLMGLVGFASRRRRS